MKIRLQNIDRDRVTLLNRHLATFWLRKIENRYQNIDFHPKIHILVTKYEKR